MAAGESISQLFAQKLKELKGTQEGIETLSHWVQFHRKKIPSIIRVWSKELAREGPAYNKKKLLMLYVANDVMQASRKKHREVIAEFAKALPDAVHNFGKHCDAKGVKEMPRLINIWIERQVLSSTVGEELQRRFKASTEGQGEPELKTQKEGPKPQKEATKQAELPAPGTTAAVEAAPPIEGCSVSAASLEACYEAVSQAAKADHLAQKQADALLGFETLSAADCSQAVESVMTLKTALEKTVAARHELVQQLKTLITEQKQAKSIPSERLEIINARLETAEEIRRQLANGNLEGTPAAKRVKVEPE